MIEAVFTPVAEATLLAGLLEYPRAEYPATALGVARTVRDARVGGHALAFATAIASLTPERIEEAHVRTFLVAPSAAPYAGVHLFGEESFKRAHLMASLAGRFRELGFDPGQELPDHIGVLLRFLPLLDAEEGADLQRYCLALPLTEMKRALETSENPYRHLLAALAMAIAPDGVPDGVRASILHAKEAPDTSGCQGCKVTHGGDEL